MSYPTSRYPQVPLPVPSPPPSNPDFPHPGLRLTGTRTDPRGRSLQATATFPAGSAIAAFPRPVLCFPDGDHLRTACDWCLRPGSTSPTASSSPSYLSAAAQNTKLSACSGCGYVVYCSKKCQAAAWKAVHKLECPVLRRVKAGVFGATAAGQEREGWQGKWFVPTPVRAAMQLLLRLRAGDSLVRDAVGGVPFVGSGSGGETGGGLLEGNVEGFRRDEKMWKDLGTQARAALAFVGVELDGERMVAAAEEVRRLLCVLHTNAFDRRDEDVGAAGVFLDADLAMANHSCLPNAYVCFVGRTAVLRAEREIKAGEEIEISYIGKSFRLVGVYKQGNLLTVSDNTLSKAERHEALKSYHFECRCRRCLDDLDVYQVCQEASTIPLNTFSLQPDLQLYIDPPIDRTALTAASAARKGHKDDQLWSRCAALRDAKMYAVEPLPALLHSLIIQYETQEQNFAYALSLACFLATSCHPYAHVPPFKPWRVKGLMMVAQLLSQTAPLSAMGELGKICPYPALVERLARMDQVSMCEAVLRLVVYYGPIAHSDDWEVVANARELLDDIAQLQGRERESATIGLWATDPERPDARHFFEEVVLKPIKELAGFALDITERRLRDGDALARQAPPGSLRRPVYLS